MEKNQYDLCIKVLKRLETKGVLADVILIGSWCMPFYKDYFGSPDRLSAIRTRDIDFLVPLPAKGKIRADIPELLRDLGFITGFKGPDGCIQLQHPDLIIEFFVPERGRGSSKPFKLPQFAINAQPLRFLDLLIQETIKTKVEGIEICLPHPANFALHKLIIFQRRLKEEKIMKDKNAAIEILKAMIDMGEAQIIKRVFNSMPVKWQKKVISGLELAQQKEIIFELRESRGYDT